VSRAFSSWSGSSSSSVSDSICSRCVTITLLYYQADHVSVRCCHRGTRNVFRDYPDLFIGILAVNQ
jgi:hypothetical protein